jgi:hypothetical protein
MAVRQWEITDATGSGTGHCGRAVSALSIGYGRIYLLGNTSVAASYLV